MPAQGQSCRPGPIEALAAVRSVLNPPLPADAPRSALDKAFPDTTAFAQSRDTVAPRPLDEERDELMMLGMKEQFKRLAHGSPDDAAFGKAVRQKMQRRAAPW